MSQVAPQALSGGHRNAAAPISVASAAYTLEAIKLAVASKLVNMFMEGILFPRRQVDSNNVVFSGTDGSLLRLKMDRRGLKRGIRRTIRWLHPLYNRHRARKLAVSSVQSPCNCTNPLLIGVMEVAISNGKYS